ncbi:hypothetical protein AALA90_00075 [Lachnospiraceae bacterium 38-10]
MVDKDDEDKLNLSNVERIEKICDQLKCRENALKNDFSNLFTSLNISIAFYGAVIVLITKGIDSNGNIFIIYSIMFLLISIFTYIFGMLYYYNLFAIIKGGYVTTKLENKLVRLQENVYGEADYIGWGIVEKRRNIGRILVYGTIMMFYIILPLISIVWGINFSYGRTVDKLAIYIMLLSALCYITYFSFICIIIDEMYRFYKKFQENHDYGI